MTDDELMRYLRQNPTRRDGTPGTYTLRFFVLPDDRNLKARRVEIGLGTNDKVAALGRAQVLLLGIYALGARFSGRLALHGPYREFATVRTALPEKRLPYKDNTPRKSS